MRDLTCATVLTAALLALPAVAQVTTTYQYDDLGRLKNATYSSKNIAYNFDPAGNRTSVVTQTNTPHFKAGAVSSAKAKKPKKKQ